MPQPPQRRSRMQRQSTGQPVALTARDIDIFRLLHRYRYLRSTYIHAFVGGDRTKLVERLGHLYHEGDFVDRPPQQWDTANARHQPAIYELSQKGLAALEDAGTSSDAATWLDGGKTQFRHALMICQILASIELGLGASGLHFITWQQILRHPRCPQETLGLGKPFAFPVTSENSGSLAGRCIVPDAVFGIEYNVDARKSYRFFALEADRGSMPVTRTNRRQSCYASKLHGYRDLIRRQLQRTHLGLPNLLVLTVTTSNARKETMLRATEELSGDANLFLFKTVESGPGTDRLLYPFLELLTQPWDRAGQGPLAIDHS